jgi:hypothetical protein
MRALNDRGSVMPPREHDLSSACYLPTNDNPGTNFAGCWKNAI